MTTVERLSAPACALSLALQRLRGGGVVALYHRVSDTPDPVYPPVPTALFEAHLDCIERDFRIIPLHEFVDRRRLGRSLRGCCALTFDDGYRDFLQNALPILRRRGLHSTHFLTLDSLRSGRPTWNWRLNRVTLIRDANPCDMSLTRRVGRLTVSEREAYLADLESAQSDLPPEPPLIGPDDLEDVDPGLVEWGSHTVSHANLGACDGAAARHELTASKCGLEARTGRRIRFLAYPNGSHSQAVQETAAEAGYEAAFAVEQTEVRPDSPLFAIPRFDVWPVSPHRLRWELTGAVTRARGVRDWARRGRRVVFASAGTTAEESDPR